METILTTALSWLEKGLWMPFFVLIIGVLVFLVIKNGKENSEKREKLILEDAKKREEYLLSALEKRDAESKEDKKALMNFIDNVGDSLNKLTSCMQGIQTQIEYNNKEISMRFDFIEKKIDNIS